MLIDSLAVEGDFHACFQGGDADEFADAHLSAGGDDEIFGLFLLEHHPLHPDVILGMPPIAEGVHVAQIQAFLKALRDIRDTACDFAGDEGFATAWGFVVEEDAVASVHAIGLAVVDRDPVRVEFGHRVGGPWVERSGFLLRDFLDQPVELRRGGLVEASFLFEA